jgi:hypothetical protein
MSAALSVAEAAALLPAEDGAVGVTPNRIRLKCSRVWGPAGKAEKVNDQWRISPEADPHFRPQPRGEEIACDLRDLSDRQRETLRKKKAILRIYRESKEQARGSQAEAMRITLPRARAIWGPELHETTIRKWDKAARRGDAALVDGRARRQGSHKERQDDPYLNFVADLYLRLNGLKLSACIHLAQGQALKMGWKIWGDGIVRRFINRIPQTTVILRRKGRAAFEAQCAPYIERDYTTAASNEQWISDHHTLDVIVRIGTRVDPNTGEEKPIFGRPYLTPWMDLRSRLIVGHVIGAAYPSTDTIIRSLAMGCRKYGVPEGVYFDNGDDFSAKVLTGETKAEKRRRRGADIDLVQLECVYGDLGIKRTQTWPYHPMSKGMIERWFGRVADQFCRTFPTYCGKDTVSKPEGLEDRLKQAPTLEEFKEKFALWLEHDYHQSIHHGDGMDGVPAEVWKANLVTKRTAPADVLELLLWPRFGPLTIGRNGVCHKGLWYGQSDLIGRQGEKVYVRVNPEDLSSVRVYDLAGKIICVANANRRVPAITRDEDLRAAIAEKKRISRTLREAARQGPRMYHDLTDLTIEAAMARNAAAGKPDPQTSAPAVLKPIRSAHEEELKLFPLKADRSASEVDTETVFDLLALETSEDQKRQYQETLRSQAQEVVARQFMANFGGGAA